MGAKITTVCAIAILQACATGTQPTNASPTKVNPESSVTREAVSDICEETDMSERCQCDRDPVANFRSCAVHHTAGVLQGEELEDYVQKATAAEEVLLSTRPDTPILFVYSLFVKNSGSKIAGREERGIAMATYNGLIYTPDLPSSAGTHEFSTITYFNPEVPEESTRHDPYGNGSFDYLRGSIVYATGTVSATNLDEAIAIAGEANN